MKVDLSLFSKEDREELEFRINKIVRDAHLTRFPNSIKLTVEELSDNCEITCACNSYMELSANTKSMPIKYVFRCEDCGRTLYLFQDDPEEYRKD